MVSILAVARWLVLLAELSTSSLQIVFELTVYLLYSQADWFNGSVATNNMQRSVTAVSEAFTQKIVCLATHSFTHAIAFGYIIVNDFILQMLPCHDTQTFIPTSNLLLHVADNDYTHLVCSCEVVCHHGHCCSISAVPRHL